MGSVEPHCYASYFQRFANMTARFAVVAGGWFCSATIRVPWMVGGRAVVLAAASAALLP